MAEQMETEATTVVALLHDLVDDTDYTIEDLVEMVLNNSDLSRLDVVDEKALKRQDKYLRAIALLEI